jgi:hypothetical protein
MVSTPDFLSDTNLCLFFNELILFPASFPQEYEIWFDLQKERNRLLVSKIIIEFHRVIK